MKSIHFFIRLRPKYLLQEFFNIVNIGLTLVPLNSVSDLSLKNTGVVLSTSEILF